MKCPKCGNELAENKKFCSKCGCNIEEFAKGQKEKVKEERAEKFYKIKKRIALVLILILAIAILVLTGLNILGKKSHKPKKEYSVLETNNKINEEYENAEGGVDVNIELTEENKREDYDRDYLSNEEESQLGTSMIKKDTDEDGLTDYEEVKRYKSDPLKYSTADDGICDYAKAKRELDFNRKYTSSEVKPEEVEVGYNIKLIPEDLESQYFGGLKQYENDRTVNSTYSVFNMIDFKGTVEYETKNENSILLVRKGTEYEEFKNYKNEGGKLIITITEDDNFIDMVITTKENFEKYQKGE